MILERVGIMTRFLLNIWPVRLDRMKIVKPGSSVEVWWSYESVRGAFVYTEIRRG